MLQYNIIGNMSERLHISEGKQTKSALEHIELYPLFNICTQSMTSITKAIFSQLVLTV